MINQTHVQMGSKFLNMVRVCLTAIALAIVIYVLIKHFLGA